MPAMANIPGLIIVLGSIVDPSGNNYVEYGTKEAAKTLLKNLL